TPTPPRRKSGGREECRASPAALAFAPTSRRGEEKRALLRVIDVTKAKEARVSLPPRSGGEGQGGGSRGRRRSSRGAGRGIRAEGTRGRACPTSRSAFRRSSRSPPPLPLPAARAGGGKSVALRPLPSRSP